MHARGERELLLGVQERERNGNKKNTLKIPERKGNKRKNIPTFWEQGQRLSFLVIARNAIY